MPRFWKKSDLNPKYQMDAAMLASNEIMEYEFIRFYYKYESMIRERLSKLRDWYDTHPGISYQKLVGDIFQIYLSKCFSRATRYWYKPADRFLDEEIITDLDRLLAVVHFPTERHREELRERAEVPWASFVTADFRRYMHHSLLGLGMAVIFALPVALVLIVPLFVTGVAIFWSIAALLFTLTPVCLLLPNIVYHHDFDILNAHNKLHELSLHLDALASQKLETVTFQEKECPCDLEPQENAQLVCP